MTLEQQATKKRLQGEFAYYIAHQAEFVEQYEGKVLAIKDRKVLGVYDDELTAVTETKKSHDIGTFFVQRVSKGDADYVQHYHSRVVFS